MPNFELLRFSLSVPTIGNLARDEERKEPDLSRIEFLREMFSNRIDFFYAGRLYTYVPSPKETQGEKLYSGFVGKPVEELVNSGPEKLFALTRSKHYKASFVCIDISPDQQVVAFEKRQDVGASMNILKALIEKFVSDRKGFSWHIDVEFLSSETDFWKAAKKNRGHITELSFEFYPPNGLKGFDKFKEFDRVAKQQANGQSSEYSLKNGDGAIDPSGEFVESAVEYASEGPGKIVMKDGKKIIYNSRQAKRIIDVPEQIMPRQGEPTKILGVLASIFGKKNG